MGKKASIGAVNLAMDWLVDLIQTNVKMRYVR